MNSNQRIKTIALGIVSATLGVLSFECQGQIQIHIEPLAVVPRVEARVVVPRIDPVVVVAKPVPVVEETTVEAPTPEVNFEYFHDQLAPFGEWVEVRGVKYWRPTSALQANPDWRPYYDMGRWKETENGLFWESDFQWGDIPFHYGRWIKDPELGWLWAPDYTWGPAWVFWRHAEEGGAIGWAPLPVGAVFVDGGFTFNGASVAADFDFGLGESVFTFVDYDHFHETFFRLRGREYAHHFYGRRFHELYARSRIRNEFRRDEHGRFVNHGIGHDRLGELTHHRVEHANLQERAPRANPVEPAKGSNSDKQPDKSHSSPAASKDFKPSPTHTPKQTPSSPAKVASGGNGKKK